MIRYRNRSIYNTIWLSLRKASLSPEGVSMRKLNEFKDQIPLPDRHCAKIDYLQLPLEEKGRGKLIAAERVKEDLIFKLEESGHPIKRIHMKHFTDHYAIEVMRIRDKHINDGFIQFFIEFENEDSVWKLLPCEESLVDGSNTYDLKSKYNILNRDIATIINGDISMSRLTYDDFERSLAIEQSIKKFKETHPNPFHVYLTVRDMRTGYRADFLTARDVKNYLSEKVFGGDNEPDYLLHEPYSGKYSIWFPSRAVTQGIWNAVYTKNYAIIKNDLILNPNGEINLEANVGACSIVLSSSKIEATPVAETKKVRQTFKVRKQQTKFIRTVRTSDSINEADDEFRPDEDSPF